MTDNPFLREVIDDPDNDQARLIYADYLEEQGDARGEFIRVQCELARADRLSPEYEDLFERSSELLMQHRDAWASELKQDVKKIDFRRGFIDTVTVLARRLLKSGDELFQSAPIQWLRLNRVGGVGPQLADAPILSKIRRLDLSNLKIPIDDLTPLLRSPQLDSLIELDLDFLQTEWDAAFGAALAEMPAASRLQTLMTRCSETLRPQFVEALVAGEFDELRTLSLGSDYGQANSWSGIGALRAPKLESLRVFGGMKVDFCKDLSRLPVAQLRRLRLSGTRAPALGLKALAEQGAFDRLEELDLTNCASGARAAKTLFEGERLSACRVLTLGSSDGPFAINRNTPLLQGLRERRLPKLEHLTLHGLTMGQMGALALSPPSESLLAFGAPGGFLAAADIEALCRSPLRSVVRWLDFRSSRFERDSLEALDKLQPAFDDLLRLDLSSQLWAGYEGPISCLTGDEVLAGWLRAAMPSLQVLRLDWSGVTDKSLKLLAEADLPELRSVDLHGQRYSTKVLQKVLDSPSLPKLRRLQLSAGQNPGVENYAFGSRVTLG